MLNLRTIIIWVQFHYLSVHCINYLNSKKSSDHLIVMMSYQSFLLYFVFCFKVNGTHDE